MKRPNWLVLLALTAGCAHGTGGAAGTVEAAGPASAQTAEVKGTPALRFSPSTVRARVGRLTLTLGNVGGTPHNLAFLDPGLPALGLVGSGETRSQTYTFTRPGSYQFQCTIHAGMTGTVVVR